MVWVYSTYVRRSTCQREDVTGGTVFHPGETRKGDERYLIAPVVHERTSREGCFFYMEKFFVSIKEKTLPRRGGLGKH